MSTHAYHATRGHYADVSKRGLKVSIQGRVTRV